jgi:hypothetical protein
MNEQSLSPRADLEFADIAIREVLHDEFRAVAGADAASLDRIRIHVINIQEAVNTSPERRANAAKRLSDFAATASRMSTRHPDAAPQLAKLCNALQAASLQVKNLAQESEPK